jgi:hypothetical protein
VSRRQERPSRSSEDLSGRGCSVDALAVGCGSCGSPRSTIERAEGDLDRLVLVEGACSRRGIPGVRVSFAHVSEELILDAAEEAFLGGHAGSVLNAGGRGAGEQAGVVERPMMRGYVRCTGAHPPPCRAHGRAATFVAVHEFPLERPIAVPDAHELEADAGRNRDFHEPRAAVGAVLLEPPLEVLGEARVVPRVLVGALEAEQLDRPRRLAIGTASHAAGSGSRSSSPRR